MKRQYWALSLVALLTLPLVLLQPMQAKGEFETLTNEEIIQMIESQSGEDLTPEEEEMINEELDDIRDGWEDGAKTSGADISAEGIPSFNGCLTGYINPIVGLILPQLHPEDTVSMSTVKNGNIAKTVHVEKELFRCFTEQGGIRLAVDVTVFVEIFENLSTKEILSKQAQVITCLKLPETAAVLDCESKPVPQDVAPVRNCDDETILFKLVRRDISFNIVQTIFEVPINQTFPTHPQEMNTVNKGSIVKTVEAQKEIFVCNLDAPTNVNDSTNDIVICCFGPLNRFALIFPVNEKKVELTTFTEIWENLNLLPDNPVIKKAFESARCVVTLIVDGDGDGDADPFDREDRLVNVESCKFSTFQD